MNKVNTIVFDLYNTLIKIKEPRHFFLNLFNKSENGFDLDLASYTRLLMTKDLREVVESLPSEFEELYNRYLIDLEDELKSVVVFDEVPFVLNELRPEFQLCLISNLASPYKKPFFDNGLEQYFDKVIFSSDYGFLKPERTIFKKLEDLTGNKADEVLMVGDSLKSDVEGAKKMGWHYLRVKRTGIVENRSEIKDLSAVIKHISKTEKD
ncbi:HAD family hydrolase [Limibacter armeniacum]|uniref:HAD family hydrolase n=1 Tax=Limibacter armeniacum TaxID=466084 RepID=UPI002FE6AC99